MTERKWYIKDEGRTTLWGFPDDVALHHPTAIEVEPRPSGQHVWHTTENKWYIPDENV